MSYFPSGYVDTSLDIIDTYIDVNNSIVKGSKWCANTMNPILDEIDAIERELGVNPAGSYDTVVLRLDALESSVPTGTGVTAHNELTGLENDDHTQYLLAAGTRALTNDWDAGNYEIRAQTLQADVSNGTSPLTITSQTVVTNLNVDLLDGNHADAFSPSGHNHDSSYISIISIPLEGNIPLITAGGELINSEYSPDSFSPSGHNHSYAEVSFSTIEVSGQNNIVASSPTDTLTFIAGSNVIITTNETNDSLTISATGEGGTSDHGELTGLDDDDHTQYLLADGTRGLTGDWDAGSHKVKSETFESDVAEGTPPLTIASSTVCTNLNADLLDGFHSDAFATSGHVHSGTYAEFAFKTIEISGQAAVVADSVDDTLTIIAGTGISLATSGDTITITSSGSSPGAASMWVTVPGSPSRTDGDTFTIADVGNAGLYNYLLQRGTILKWTDTTTHMACVVSASYAGDVVTVNIMGDTLDSSATMNTMQYFCGEKARVTSFAYAGTMYVATNIMGQYNMPMPAKIFGADGYHGTAGKTNATTYDINKNGSTVFTAKVSIASDQTKGEGYTANDNITAAVGDYFTVDCDSVSYTRPVDAYINLLWCPLYIQYLS
jgi:hypothetical protein